MLCSPSLCSRILLCSLESCGEILFHMEVFIAGEKWSLLGSIFTMQNRLSNLSDANGKAKNFCELKYTFWWLYLQSAAWYICLYLSTMPFKGNSDYAQMLIQAKAEITGNNSKVPVTRFFPLKIESLKRYLDSVWGRGNIQAHFVILAKLRNLYLTVCL